MKIYSSIFIFLVFLAHSSGVFAQQPAGATSEGDTTIVISKELARKIQQEYSNVQEITNDMVPDYSKGWMVTDRPHVAESPFLVAKGWLQWESGFQFEQTKSNAQRIKEYTYNTTLVRLGLSRRFEVRFETDYLGTKINGLANDSLKKNTSGFSGLKLGSKVFLCDHKGWRPKCSLLYGIGLPFIGSKEYRPENMAGEIKFLFANEITHFYELEYNVGFEWQGDSKKSVFAYALNNEFMLSRKMNFFVELYGYLYENNGADDRFNGTYINDHRLDGGIWYLFNENFQFDVSAGVGLSNASPDYFVSFGLSNRFLTSKKK